ncbi:MAG: glycosyltransferase family 1 protein [Epsilonproteobacteria bacterium]|nr:MAG: glycosyltransferase family 1 protein [Campylobacterota bacterium]RLA67783.1 MAG: glycosyltransferase family 1 protein [Campylobacterota bacterium]
MRIGFDAKRVFHNFRGLGNYSRTLISGLDKYYPKDELYLFTPDFSDKTWIKNHLDLKVITPEKSFFKRFPTLWRSIFLGQDLLKYDLDIYHGLSHEIPPFIEKQNIKKVVTIHDLLFLRYPENFPWIDRQVYKWKFSSSCHRADLIVAICEQTKKDIIEFLNIPQEKIKVLYQSCNPLFYKKLNAKTKSDYRKKYSLPDKFILYVGALEVNKNVINLIRAYKKTDTAMPLVIVGRGENYKKLLEKEIIDLGIKEKILFLDFVPLADLPGLYQNAHLFVFPSFFEGFGLPIVEAMFSGVPVITTKGSCFPEAGGPNTIYVDPHGPDELCIAIKTVLGNDMLRHEMIQKGLEYVTKFTSEATSHKLRQVYQNLLKTHK